jgi:hypothetical protein
MSSRPSSPSTWLPIILLPLYVLQVSAQLDFSPYPSTSQVCLYAAAGESNCNGLIGSDFYKCACGTQATFLPLVVQCVAASAPNDLSQDYFTAESNCASSGTPIEYTEQEFLALASSTTSNVLSHPSTSGPVPFPTNSPTPISSEGIHAEINGKPLSTGAIVGVVIALLIFFGLVAVAIALCCIYSRRRRRKNLDVQLNNLEFGAKGSQAPVNGAYKQAPVTTASVTTTPGTEGQGPLASPMNPPYQHQTGVVHPTEYQQQPGAVDSSGYQQGQQQIDPRYSVYSSPISPTSSYAFPNPASPPPAYVQPQPQPYLAQNQYPSPASTAVSPVSPVPSAAGAAVGAYSRPELVEMDSTQSLPTMSALVATAMPVTRARPVELGAGAENQTATGEVNPHNPEKVVHPND